MTKKERELKLLGNEIVLATTFELATKICELAHKLGLTWLSGHSYEDSVHWTGHKGQ